MWEGHWLCKLSVVALHGESNTFLSLENFLEVAGSHQLVEVVDIESFIRSVVLFAEPRVDDWVLLTFREILFVFKVKKMS